MSAEGVIDAGKLAEAVDWEKEIDGCCFPDATTPPAAPDAALVPEPLLPICSRPSAAGARLVDWAVPAVAVVFVQEDEGDAGRVAAGE